MPNRTDNDATVARLDEYVDWLRGQGLSHNTSRARSHLASKFYREMGRTWDVPRHQIANWLDQYTGWSRRTFQAGLQNLYIWLVETGQVETNLLDGIKRVPQPKSAPRPLTRQEFDRALSHAQGDVRAWLLLAGLAGLRAHEIAKFRGEDITADWIRVVGKGRMAAVIPTHPELWALAQKYPRQGIWFPSKRVDNDGPISGKSLGTRVGYFFRDLNIDGSIHRVRHFYGTTLVRSGANIRVVQELMRHASLVTTQAYLGVDRDEMRTAVFRLSGEEVSR